MMHHRCRFSRAVAVAMVLLLVLSFALLQPAGAAALADPANGPTIRVGIAWAKSSVAVTASGGFSVVDEKTGQTVVQFASSLTFSESGGGIAITNYGRCDGPLTLTAAAGADNYLTYAGRRYRGSMRIVTDNAGLILINVLPLEEYLFGVVPREVGADWPIEAQKAQAVSARTFALASTGKYGSYDVRNTTESQVYGGLNDEKPLSTEAVLATAGEVATYQGKLISTYFYSSSGGYTESNENVWPGGSPLPYLRSQPDPFDSIGPWNSWHRDLTLDEIGRLLAAAGYDVGTLYEIIPENRVASGRWVWVTARGSKGSIRMSSNAFRIAVGTYTLPSTLFTMTAHDAGLTEIQQSYATSATLTVLGAGGQTAATALGGATVISANGTATLGAGGEAGLTVVGKQMVPAGLSFDGSGWGHGVGMSQWGTYGMAVQGYSYQDILKHYYTGIEIVRWPNGSANGPQQ
ncbi:MAG: SpoIID/LytB domain-containing protein [Chloroflexota bacterium]